MPKFHAIAKPTGMKRAQLTVEVDILAADKDEAAKKLRELLAGRDEYVITEIREVAQ